MRRAFAVSVVAAGLALIVIACGGRDAPRAVFVPPERVDADAPDATLVAEAIVPDATPLPAAAELPEQASEPEPSESALAQDPTLRYPTSMAVSFAAMRGHSELSRIGPILAQHPVAADAKAAGIDVLRDLDSFVAYGPSLAQTDRTFALIRYHVADRVVDAAVSATAAKVLGRPHGPADAGVPGLSATLGYNQDAPRLFVRPQPRLLAIFPPSLAQAELAALKTTPPKAPPAGEVLRMRFRKPKQHITLPAAKAIMPEALDELRLWGLPDPSGGVYVTIEGDCATEAAASDLAFIWTKQVREWNTIIFRVATHGALNNVAFAATKRKVSAHVMVSQDQVVAMMNTLASMMNVTLPSRPDAGP